jgi:hypothetical protein
MKKRNKRILNKNQRHHEGKHSFLFWLVTPLILVWLSVGYLFGLTGDKPIWFKNDNTFKKTNAIVPYFQEHGSFAEDLNQPFITLWFDDAWLSQYMNAYPVLSKNSFPAAIAVSVNSIETPNYMNWAQLQTVQKKGWEITNHSLQHDCTMQNWVKNNVISEYKNSKYILWKNKLTSDIFVTPCGVDSKIMREESIKNFMGYRTVDPGYNNPKDINAYNLKVKNIDNKTNVEQIRSWISETKKTNSWTILVFHKVGEDSLGLTEDEYNTPLKDFKKIVDYIKESGIKVVIPSQIIASQNKYD